MRGTGERILSLCSAAPKCSPKRALRSPKMRKRMQGRRRSTKRPPTFLILTTRWRQRQTLKPRTIFISEVKVLKRLEGQTSQRRIITKDIDPSHCFCSRKDCSWNFDLVLFHNLLIFPIVCKKNGFLQRWLSAGSTVAVCRPAGHLVPWQLSFPLLSSPHPPIHPGN